MPHAHLARAAVATTTIALAAVTGAAASAAPARPAAAKATTAKATTAKATTAKAPALKVRDIAYVDVSVATLWSKPGLARKIDAPSLTNPADPRRWNANMRTTASREWLSGGGSRLETQALLGAKVQVTAVQGAWVKVVAVGQPTPRDARGYPGWVPAVQLSRSDVFATRMRRNLHAVVTANTTWLATRASLRNPTTEISVNTELPVLSRSAGVVRVALPDGGSRYVSAKAVAVRSAATKLPRPTGAQIITTGSRFLGLRYLWAGTSAFGFDCSGFTSAVYKIHGITLPRDAGPQSQAGTPVARKNLRPGDLVFFAGPGGKGSVHHVAIYAGGGKILQSPNSSRSVEIMSLAAFDTRHEYSGARRFL